MTAALAGFGLGFSLILAIGAQNAFVLRQGIARAHVLPVVLACALSDAVLIAVGVAGFNWVEAAIPALAPSLRWAGAAFLVVYGAMAFRSAWCGAGALRAARSGAASAFGAVLTSLALTWLNPHVYLDTVVLLGSVSTQYDGAQLAFGAGATVASFVFFFSLGFGARLLAPVFERPQAWRVLDILVGVVMWAIAAGLIFG